MKALAIYKDVKRLHECLHNALGELKSQLVKLSEEEIADTTFILRRCAELLDDSRKECDKLKSPLSNLGCLSIIQNGGRSLEGKYAKAHGRPRFACKIPSHTANPELYREVCEALELPYHPDLRLHWPSVQERMTEIFKSGKRLPPVLEQFKQYEENQLVAVVRSENELDSDAMATVGITEA